LRAHRRAIRDGADPISLLFEKAHKHVANALIVVDDQNMNRVFLYVSH
jgi:hypothetical protein